MNAKLQLIRSRVDAWVRYRPAHAARFVLVLALLAVPLAACSVTRSGAITPAASPAAATGATTGATSPSSTSSGTTPTSTGSSAATPSSASAPASATATPTGTTPSAAVVAAIKSVIQRGNQEQAQALAAGNPALMQDTATSSYYAQLVQTQNAMASSGVSSIKLVKLTWGPITLTSATTAQATTVETWSTTLADGSTQQQTDTNVYTLVLQSGAWRVQADAQPNAPQQQTPSTASNPSGNPNPVSPIAPAGGVGQSQNWAGYAATGGNFTAVSGSWTVPQISPSSTPGADATWVGIGGVTATDLIQAGTDAAVQGGQVTYAAWIETLPQAQQTVPLTISAGDNVSVAITQQSSGLWQVVIRDVTTGQSYQKSVSYASSNSSAEWVEEAPAVGPRAILPLDSFGTVTISGASTVENGKTQTIAQAGGQAITMYSTAGQVLAQPSGISSNGSSFTVTRTGASASPSFPGSGGYRRGGFSG